MPLIIDTLCEHVNFTVNTAVSYVAIEAKPALLKDYPILRNTFVNGIFRKGEGFTLLSAGYVLPENFSLYTDNVQAGGILPIPSMSLFLGKKDSIDTAPIKELGETKHVNSLNDFYLPLENYESAFMLPVDPVRNFVENSIVSAAYVLRAYLHNIRISMYNIPAGYNETVQRIRMFIKVAHTSPLATIAEPS